MHATTMDYPGNLFVVAAPSGAGKSSLVKALMELDARVQPSVSHTTRAPRGQEKHGREYFFVSQQEFDAMVLADGFVSRDEFQAYQKKRFDEFDSNHDGKIDAKEIASSPPLMERNLKTAERMVKEWDTNGDGVVTADEFKKDADARFTKQDKAGTGKIPRPGKPTAPPKGMLMPNAQPQPQPMPAKP